MSLGNCLTTITENEGLKESDDMSKEERAKLQNVQRARKQM